MSAGDRNETGRPKDYVIHFIKDGKIVCGTKNIGALTEDIDNIDWPVTCKKCIKFIKNVTTE